MIRNRILPPSRTAIYRGAIRHRRFHPVNHEFTYNLSMVLLDLEHLERELDVPGLVGCSRPALGRFRRSDYIGEPGQSLRETIVERVEAETGLRPDGKVTLLTHLRYWGFMMNPLAVFYCYDRSGDLVAVALQVTNTPWREKILYVLKPDPAMRKHTFRFHKRMHVSPFNPMQMEYLCRFATPGEQLVFHLENHVGDHCHTDATMVFHRVPATTARLVWLSIRQPAMTLIVGLGIYWQALRLWLKKSPVYDHPGRARAKAAPLALKKVTR